MAISAAALTLAFGLFWWLEVRAFSELTSCSQISWKRPDKFPWIKGSKWWPFGTIAGFALQEPPTDPASYSNALRKIDSIDRMMVFSFGKVDQRVWDAFGEIKIRSVLDLNYTSVDDDAFASFDRAGSIDHLILSDTLVTPAALQSVSRFQRLEKISIQGISVSKGIVEEVHRPTHDRQTPPLENRPSRRYPFFTPPCPKNPPTRPPKAFPPNPPTSPSRNRVSSVVSSKKRRPCPTSIR